MAEADLIGVVTVTYNSASVLPGFLRSLAEQTHNNYLLFAVDNASKDDSVRLLSEWNDDRLRIVANQDNLGVAAGNNQGILAALDAGCSFVLILNNDTEFSSTLITQLLEALDTYRVEMSCPKIMYFDEPGRIWAAGGTFQPWLGYRSKHFGEGEMDRGQYDCARLVTYVPTCCVLISRKVFESVGLMDERYFVYVDDVDFMYRALKAGVKLIYIPEAKLLHKVGRLTGGEESPFNIRYCARNRVYFMLKHLGRACSIPIMLVYQLYYAAGLCSGRFSFKVFRIKERAVLEGIAIWKQYRLSRIIACPR